MELLVLVGYGLGIKFLYPPKNKSTKGLKQFIAQILITNGATFVLDHIRQVSVFLLQRMPRRRELQAGIDCLKSPKCSDPALIYKNYHKGRIKFYWQEYVRHPKFNNSAGAFGLAIMPYLKSIHPNHATRIQASQKIIDK